MNEFLIVDSWNDLLVYYRLSQLLPQLQLTWFQVEGFSSFFDLVLRRSSTIMKYGIIKPPIPPSTPLVITVLSCISANESNKSFTLESRSKSFISQSFWDASSLRPTKVDFVLLRVIVGL